MTVCVSRVLRTAFFIEGSHDVFCLEGSHDSSCLTGSHDFFCLGGSHDFYLSRAFPCLNHSCTYPFGCLCKPISYPSRTTSNINGGSLICNSMNSLTCGIPKSARTSWPWSGCFFRPPSQRFMHEFSWLPMCLIPGTQQYIQQHE